MPRLQAKAKAAQTAAATLGDTVCCGACGRNTLRVDTSVQDLTAPPAAGFNKLAVHDSFCLEDWLREQYLVPTTLGAGASTDAGWGNLLLAPAAVDGAGLTVCTQCFSSLQGESLGPPKFSIANYNFFGSAALVPELACLTFPEQLLLGHSRPFISRANVITVYASAARGAWVERKKLKGHLTTFEQNPTHLVEAVADNRVGPTLTVHLCTGALTDADREKQIKNTRTLLNIRRDKVLAAHQWFMDHNPLYKESGRVPDFTREVAVIKPWYCNHG